MGGKGKQKENSMGRITQISKALTQVLRHKAVDLGLNIGPDGYVLFEEILGSKMVKKLNATAQELEDITRDSDKKRFEIRRDRDGRSFIRAVQGHSMKIVEDDQLLKSLAVDDPDLPHLCVHGTYRRHFESIMEKGLIAGGKMGQAHRNHIHFAPREPGDNSVISGMRYDCDMGIWVDLAAAIRHGIPFFMAENQVILTPGSDGVVPSVFFLQVKDLRSGELIHTATSSAAPGSAHRSNAIPEPLVFDELATLLAKYRA